jgi:hypothetical protein
VWIEEVRNEMMGEEKKEANAVADLVGVLIAAEFGGSPYTRRLT